MTGLFAFFYGSLHFLTYTIADRFAGLDFPDGIVAWSTVRNLAASVAADIYKRPFITIGFTAFVLMVPLAVTSTAGMIRRLGGKRWHALHRLIYVSAVAGVAALLLAGEGRRQTAADLRARSSPCCLGVRVYWSRAKALMSRPVARARREARKPPRPQHPSQPTAAAA